MTSTQYLIPYQIFVIFSNDWEKKDQQHKSLLKLATKAPPPKLEFWAFSLSFHISQCFVGWISFHI